MTWQAWWCFETESVLRLAWTTENVKGAIKWKQDYRPEIANGTCNYYYDCVNPCPSSFLAYRNSLSLSLFLLYFSPFLFLAHHLLYSATTYRLPVLRITTTTATTTTGTKTTIQKNQGGAARKDEKDYHQPKILSPYRLWDSTQHSPNFGRTRPSNLYTYATIMLILRSS